MQMGAASVNHLQLAPHLQPQDELSLRHNGQVVIDTRLRLPRPHLLSTMKRIQPWGVEVGDSFTSTWSLLKDDGTVPTLPSVDFLPLTGCILIILPECDAQREEYVDETQKS